MKKGRIMMKSSSRVAEVFSDFMLHCKAKGLSEKTLATYSHHFSAICKHLDSSAFIEDEDIIKRDLEIMVASMRDAGLSSNSIRCYTRTLKSFLTWCNFVIPSVSFCGSIQESEAGSRTIIFFPMRAARSFQKTVWAAP